VTIAVTVDVVLLAVRDGELCALAVRRGSPPFEARWALPGGFVEDDEDLVDAARRELAEETGVEAAELEQLGAYGTPGRDPRGRTVSVAYVGLGRALPDPVAASDAADAAWRPVRELLAGPLAFDHADILRDAVGRVAPGLELIEFPADDLARARHFWEELLGATLDDRRAGEGEGLQTHGAVPSVGVHERGRGPGDRFSLPYFRVPDLTRALERVQMLGGSVVHPGERWAVCRDTEGSPFGLRGPS
jgi:8-oxo-dGTP diphosphatase